MTALFLAGLLFLLACDPCNIAVEAASVGAISTEVKKQAEARGYAFLNSHDEIVAKAKTEGKLRVLTSLEAANFKPMMESLRKKYPFIDIRIDEISGTDSYQRFLLELKAGAVKDFDTHEAGSDFYNDSAAHAMKFDILGIAQQGVLKINPKMIDPDYRNMVSVATTVCAIGYNKNLITPEKVPAKWEDFLKPEFKGRKFLVDIRTQCMAALVAGVGEEWVVNYARGLKEQEPIWVRGNTRALNSILAGEYALHQMTFWHNCVASAKKSPVMECKILEPAPVLLRETQYVLESAPHPHAALLFIEHLASPEGQKVIDDYEPLKASLYFDGAAANIIKGKRLSLNDHKTFQNTPDWMKKIVEAYGFPREEKIK